MASYTTEDLRARLGEYDARIKRAEAAYAKAKKNLEDLRVERAGAEAFISTLDDSSTDSVPVAPRANTSQGIGVAATVEALLSRFPSGVSVSDLVQIAQSEGHEDFDGERIRQSLKYLGRQRKADNIGRGRWAPRRAESAPTNETGPAFAEPVAPSPSQVTLEAVGG